MIEYNSGILNGKRTIIPRGYGRPNVSVTIQSSYPTSNASSGMHCSHIHLGEEAPSDPLHPDADRRRYPPVHGEANRPRALERRQHPPQATRTPRGDGCPSEEPRHKLPSGFRTRSAIHHTRPPPGPQLDNRNRTSIPGGPRRDTRRHMRHHEGNVRRTIYIPRRDGPR